MYRTHLEAPAHKALRRTLAALCLLLGVSPLVHAQAGATTADGAPSEAARRAALSPYRFILAAPARKAPEKEREKEKAKPAPADAPVQAAARTPPPLPIAAPAPVEAKPTPAATPAEPVQTAARTRAPEPPPARREVIPVRTDEPRLSAALLREKPNGVVRVQFEIHPDGSTREVKVLASTNRTLNRPSTEAVALWKFQPVDEVLTVETELAYKYD